MVGKNTGVGRLVWLVKMNNLTTSGEVSKTGFVYVVNGGEGSRIKRFKGGGHFLIFLLSIQHHG